MQGKIIILTLSEGWYDETVFTNSDRLISPTFTELNLTVNQILESDI